MARKKTEGKVTLERGAYKRALGVLKYIKPYRITFALGLIFLLLSSITTMGFPYLIGALLGSQQENYNFLDPVNIVLALFVVFAANAIFSFFRIYLFSIVTEETLKDIRSRAFFKLIHSPISFYDANKVGELTSRIATDVNLLHELLMTSLAEFIRQWITILIALFFIFSIQAKLALIMLAVIPFIAVGAVIFGKFIKKKSKLAQDAAATSNNIIEEALMGIKNVKSFVNEQFEIQRYKNQTEAVKKLGIQGAIWRGIFASFIIIGMFGAITFVIYSGVNMVRLGEMNSVQFNQFIMFTIILGASFGGVGSLMGTIQKAVGATERLLEILSYEEEKSAGTKPEVNGKINFEQVCFAYATRKESTVLTNVSFSCEAGENIAIVGPSGAGKSTITSLILGFYNPSFGTISIDDNPIQNIDLQYLRNHIAIVPQEVILFSGSIRENIAYGNPKASEDEIIQAAINANAMDFISSFKEGLNTMVGDRGIQLSGGQKQRIAIARAVLKNPKILILDEATSSLDSESEKLVQDALEKLMRNRTSIVIAHRLSTIKRADKILVLEKGQIVEIGTHNELLANAGIYSNLSSIQLAGN